MMPPSPHRLVSQSLSEAGFLHGFFTRQGGVSKGSYASLNASLGVGDQRPSVLENRRRMAAQLDVELAQLLLARQVHGCAVLVAEELHGTAASAYEADAIVGLGSSNVACAVQTADCVPILLADPATGSAAAVHAGWRGIEKNVVAEAARRLAAHGADPSHLLAAIGPHISLAAFEVGEEVALALESVHRGAEQVVQRAEWSRPHVSLELIVRSQLLELGLRGDQIETVGGCTVGDPDLFFSYRRDGKLSGRQLSAIVPKRVRGA